jgi:branched-chain amino acid transport system permease protein
MQLFAQQLVNGLAVGSQYALWAVGYGLVFQVLGLMHFAHGDTLLLCLYITFALVVSAMLPFYVAALVVLLLAAFLAMVVYQGVYRPLIARNDAASAFIAALGAAFILRNIAILLFGRQSRVFPPLLPQLSVTVGGIFVILTPFVMLALALGVVAVFGVFLKRNRYGQAIGYLAQDREAAALVGVPVRLMVTLVYALSGVIGMVGALLFISTYGVLDSTTGFFITLKAFVAAMIGGIGRIEGAILGGLLLGVLEGLIVAYISTLYVDALVFAILGIILLVKPSGFLGRTNILRP